MFLTHKPYQRGFTLIELLVVIAIISILTGIVLASVSEARKNSKIKAAKAEVSEFELEIKLYEEQYGYYPPGTTVPEDHCSLCSLRAGNMSQTRTLWGDIVSLLGMPPSAIEDPWGNPYGYDNNQYVANTNLYTTLCSAGPDGDLESWDHANQPSYLKANVSNPQPKGDDICVFMR